MGTFTGSIITPQYFEVTPLPEFMAEMTLFEKILAGDVPANFVAKGENWGAFLDVFPRREGHTLVVPKSPVQYVNQLPSSELLDLMKGLQETQSILSKYFNTTDFTILVHDGPLAGQEIPHLHIHVIPRTKLDGGKSLPSLFPNTIIPETPNFIELSDLCKKIKEAIQ